VSMASETGPFRFDECGDLTGLRRALEANGYTAPRLSQTTSVGAASNAMDGEAVLRRVPGDSPYDTLVRLFALARAVPEGAARAAVAPAELAKLLALGLLKRCEGGLRAEAALFPLDDMLLARDFWHELTGVPLARDFVMGVGPVSRLLGRLTVRREGERALDLGTGSGVQALWAARHAARVVGTDTNARALNFAELNARLNGVRNVEFRQGSLYEPVAGESFDLIVANPPFVISPSRDYEYRDSGMGGDTVSERVLRGAPERLREGGYCTVLMSWHHRTADDWAERPTQWVEASGCDASILAWETADPVGYAASWLRETGAEGSGRYAAMLDEWLSYYEQLGVGLISTGGVILRRRSGGRNWLRASRLPGDRPVGSCSGQIQRIFAAEDLLAELGEEATLLDKTLVLTPDHQLEQTLHAKDGRWMVQGARLNQTQGFEHTGEIDWLVSTVLAACDGKHTLRELVAQTARGLGADPQQIAPGCARVFLDLLRTGFLTVARER